MPLRCSRLRSNEKCLYVMPLATLHPNFIVIGSNYQVIQENHELGYTPYKTYISLLDCAQHFLVQKIFWKANKNAKNCSYPKIVNIANGGGEQCSLGSLPFRSEWSESEKLKAKSCVMLIATLDPNFIVIGCFKLPSHSGKPWTGVHPLRSHISFIVGPSGPNKEGWSLILKG